MQMGAKTKTLSRLKTNIEGVDGLRCTPVYTTRSLQCLIGLYMDTTHIHPHCSHISISRV